MAKKEKEPKVIRLGAYELDKYIPEGGTDRMRGKDPLDEVIEIRKKHIAERAKELQAQAYIKQLEREVAEAGGTSASSNPSAQAFMNTLLTKPEVQQQWLGYTDDQRAVMLATLNALSQGGKTGGVDAMLPILFMRMNQNPTSNVRELVELVNLVTGGRKPDDEGKSIVEAIRLGFDMAQKNQPQGSKEGVLKEAMEFLKPLYDTLSKSDKALYQQQFEWLKSQIVSPADVIKTVSENAQVLGFQRSASDLEAEKFRAGENRWHIEESWKRDQWRDEMKLKQQSEKDRWNTIKTLGTTWADKAMPLIDTIVEAGKKKISGAPEAVAAGSAVAGAVAAGAATPAQETVQVLPCRECGEPIPVKVTAKGFPDKIVCDKCGTVHTKIQG